jgi:hypothetical protein
VVISEPNWQLPHWCNDTKGDASIWVTQLDGRVPHDLMNFRSDGLVGIGVGDILCFSDYCSPNLRKREFLDFIDRVHGVIKEGTRTNKRVVVAGDFNAKSASWGGEITDKKGRVLMEIQCDYGMFPLSLNHRYTFYRNGRTSCPNIISATNELSEMYGGSKVLSR